MRIHETCWLIFAMMSSFYIYKSQEHLFAEMWLFCNILFIASSHYLYKNSHKHK